ncbi:MAG: hypothetical protein M1831_004753 [Alyxoria varia]|nr:MAG: hypothetical protein M1831_004753 [Alyxoria varia]
MSSTNEAPAPTPTPNNQEPLRIAVLMEHCQLLDFACIDLIGNCSTSFLSVCVSNGWAPPHFLTLSRPIEWHYLATTLDPSFCTPDLHVKPTHTYDDCPRDLDIILLGGPPFDHRPEAADRFLKEAVPKAKIAVMSTCVGGLWLASSGVLDGKKATTNRGALPMAREIFKGVEWIDRRWVVDGKFWTAGGAAAGLDMLAAFLPTIFDPQLVQNSRDSLDVVGSRGQNY